MDINTLAKSIVEQATGDKPKPKPKSRAAVERGKARWAGVDAAEVSEHAREAANKRWHKDGDKV